MGRVQTSNQPPNKTVKKKNLLLAEWSACGRGEPVDLGHTFQVLRYFGYALRNLGDFQV